MSAMSKITISVLLALILPSIGYAQAFKCRTEGGKVVITNEGCNGGARLEKITTAAPVTFERQIQATEVNNRMIKQLDGISQEQMASNAKLQRQQATQIQQDVSQRSVGQQQAAAMARTDGAARSANCIATATARRNSSMLAECEGRPTVKNQENPWDAPDTTPPLPESKPLAIIKGCNGNSCFDQYGDRYSTTAGKTVRQDGTRVKVW